jgi:hypothetical protein
MQWNMGEFSNASNFTMHFDCSTNPYTTFPGTSAFTDHLQLFLAYFSYFEKIKVGS